MTPALSTAAEKFQDVIIRNTDAEPVPTKAVGTARVDASGSAVTLEGTPGVTLVGTPSVTVANAPAAALPYQRVVRASVAPGDQVGCASVPVPSGTLLRVENISVMVFRNSNVDVSRVFVRVHNATGMSSQELVLTTTVGNNQTAIQDTLLFAGDVAGQPHTMDICLNVLGGGGGDGGGMSSIITGTTTAVG